MAATASRGAGRGEGCDAILGLGSNIGDKAANLARSIELLTAGGDIAVVARSRDWRTPPWGVTAQDWFVNACVGVATRLPPRALLARCQDVEARMGRVRNLHWGPRVIDVDILVYGDVVIDEPGLVVPHPRIAERAFVLGPLADIAPRLEIAGQTVEARFRAIERSGVEPID